MFIYQLIYNCLPTCVFVHRMHVVLEETTRGISGTKVVSCPRGAGN